VATGPNKVIDRKSRHANDKAMHQSESSCIILYHPVKVV